MNEIVKIGETEYPVFFDWLSIESISESLGHNSLDLTAMQFSSLAGSLKFTRLVVFHGILGGYRVKKQQCPVETSEELFSGVTKFGKLNPIIEMYTKAFLEFYNSEDAELVETDKKKVNQ